MIDINRYSNVNAYLKPELWSLEKQIDNITLEKVIKVYHEYFNVDSFYKSVDKREFGKK